MSEPFVATTTFTGVRAGYTFKSGENGTGYYLESAAAAAAFAASRKRAREDDGSVVRPSLERLDEARRVYNDPAAKQPAGIDWKAAAKHGEDVGRKVACFCACFSDSIRAVDCGGKPILADARQFASRYRTVFRESGARLQMQVHHRVVFVATPEARHPRAAFVLDLEVHESLVTPVGSKYDGSLGLRGPRVQSMWVLYELGTGGGGRD